MPKPAVPVWGLFLWVAMKVCVASPFTNLTQGIEPGASTSPGDAHTDRDGKFIFTVVQFANSQCGDGLDSGTCYTENECARLGGTPFGSCARGYGTCCGVSTSGCGGDVRVNNTWVYSQNYPGSYNEDLYCTYRVYYDQEDVRICQIRYDFAAMDLAPPDSTGVCQNDRLTFREDTKSTYFCGKAPPNYHWYVDTSRTISPHTFTISSNTFSYSRRYAIRVSFIPCKQMLPSRCGQYYTGTSGTITSYNHDNGADGFYLAGLSYGICFRRETGYCTYTLRKTSDNQYMDSNDLLRLPMGEGIAMLPNPSFIPFGANAFCPSSSVQESALYSTPALCLYPEEMTSVQTQAPFGINVQTMIDSNNNRNPLISSEVVSGFEFEWETNKCTKARG